MASHSLLRCLLHLLSLVVVVLALPQTPSTTCATTPPNESKTTYYNSSSTQMIPSTTSPVVQSTPQSNHYSDNSQLTHYGGAQYEQHYPSQTKYASSNCPHEYSSATTNWHAQNNSKYPQKSTSHHSVYQGTSQFPSSSPTSMYLSTPASVSTSASPVCTPGIDVNKPGLFELWSYSPGVCDLDNKVVTSTINSPYNGGPVPYFFIDNSTNPPLPYASSGDLVQFTCPTNGTNGTASQAYLRPTHGTPYYYLLFGDPYADPTPALTLHDNFTLTPGSGPTQGKAFLADLGDTWLACPVQQNAYNGLTEYSGTPSTPHPKLSGVPRADRSVLESRSSSELFFVHD